jgi:hypothetical protein
VDRFRIADYLDRSEMVDVPRKGGHVVLDMAISQCSYGALTAHRKRGELLPVDGGFDADGNLTRDPAAIERSSRPLPIGYWKGSGNRHCADNKRPLRAAGPSETIQRQSRSANRATRACCRSASQHPQHPRYWCLFV